MNSSLGLIIPTHNRVTALEHLLTQLATQLDCPEQIIVVDDHSTDHTADMVIKMGSILPGLVYIPNDGHYQRDAKQTGLKHCHTEYVGFLDDDVVFDDPTFFTKLRSYLKPNRVVQAKIILENLGKKLHAGEHWTDKFSTKPYPIMELIPPHYECGSRPRPIYPLIEFGNFWPRQLQQHFIDLNLIIDAYGESYISGLKLYRAHIPYILEPSLVIRHPGSTTGGSQRFDKRRMTAGFRPFHQGYFYNMIYMHARYYPGWIWLWLPYFISKSLVALVLNHDFRGWQRFAWQPMWQSIIKHWWYRAYVD